MGSALLNPVADPAIAEAAADSALRAQASSAALPAQALRLQAAERLAAHRSRRAGLRPEQNLPEPARPAGSRSARIAATVAERYARTPTYRAFLAAEAERAIEQARAAAEIAELNAQAVAAIQQQLLDAFDEAVAYDAAREEAAHAELHPQLHQPDPVKPEPAQTLWPELEAPQPAAPATRAARSRVTQPKSSAAQEPLSTETPHTELASSALSREGLTVRLYEDAARAIHAGFRTPLPASAILRAGHREERNDAEARALDEEIAFRQSPVFEEPAGPTEPLPANLIEFPRQLVAARKVRPRYAEGPLLAEAEAAPGDGQLRIFEVEAAHISTTPDAIEDIATPATAPQWTSIWLDAPVLPASAPHYPLDASAIEYTPDANASNNAEPRHRHAIHSAPFGRRIAATAINAAIVLTAVLAFIATFARIVAVETPAAQASGLPMLARIAAQLAALTGLPLNLLPIALAVAVVFLTLLYQALFFSLSTATPGMRCVRLALCTFDEESPTRPAIRRRLGATLLSLSPFGLGFLWAALDEDRLTWHDRITRTYQRTY